MAPAITIAIPYYTGVDYLINAIESVLRQTISDWDLLICDDSGPESDIGAVVAKYDDPRIRYFRNSTNLGMADNWNQCLALARTDFVTILHNDDELEPNYAQLMLETAPKYSDAAGLFCNAKIIDFTGQPTTTVADVVKQWLMPNRTRPVVLRGEQAVVSLLRGNYIICPTMCYRRHLLPAEWFSRSWKMVLDLEFYLRILKEGGYLVGLPDTAYRYRRHANNSTSLYTASFYRFTEELDYYERMAQSFALNGWPLAAACAADRRIIKLHLCWQTLATLARFRFGDAWRSLRMLGSVLFKSRRDVLRQEPRPTTTGERR